MSCWKRCKNEIQKDYNNEEKKLSLGLALICIEGVRNGLALKSISSSPYEVSITTKGKYYGNKHSKHNTVSNLQ